ncbi:MAG: hypothetical protein KJO83_04155 [Bacteroidia bacterium]|nr:hypothetical protein [Bacteroidia bacterium]
MSIVINKTDRDLFPSHSIMEGNNNDFMNSLSGDLREYNESKGLKKPRTML